MEQTILALIGGLLALTLITFTTIVSDLARHARPPPCFTQDLQTFFRPKVALRMNITNQGRPELRRCYNLIRPTVIQTAVQDVRGNKELTLLLGHVMLSMLSTRSTSSSIKIYLQSRVAHLCFRNGLPEVRAALNTIKGHIIRPST